MSEKMEVKEEHTVFDKLEDLKNKVSMHVYEIGTMVALGEEAAIASTEGSKLDVEWSVVFTMIGHIQKMAQEKINELDVLLAEQCIKEQKKTPYAPDDEGEKILETIRQTLRDVNEEGLCDVFKYVIKRENSSRS
jgi:hypothetical protein